MNVMISINPPYTDMIFSGYKEFEFQSKVLNGLKEGYPLEVSRAYIYETKHKGGTGAVIGEVSIPGTYTLDYGKKPKITNELIQERYRFIKGLYLHWCGIKKVKPNMNEGWFKSKKFQTYQEEIGFCGNDGAITCNYALILDSPTRYKTPRPVSDFFSKDGRMLTRPPQGMFSIM